MNAIEVITFIKSRRTKQVTFHDTIKVKATPHSEEYKLTAIFFNDNGLYVAHEVGTMHWEVAPELIKQSVVQRIKLMNLETKIV